MFIYASSDYLLHSQRSVQLCQEQVESQEAQGETVAKIIVTNQI